MRQDVFLRLAVQDVDVVFSQVDWLYPVKVGINHLRDVSTCHASACIFVAILHYHRRSMNASCDA